MKKQSRNEWLLKLWKMRQEAEGIDVSGVNTLEEAEHFFDKKNTKKNTSKKNTKKEAEEIVEEAIGEPIEVSEEVVQSETPVEGV